MKIHRPDITDVQSDLIPDASGSRSVGTRAVAFGDGAIDTIYCDTIYGDGSNLTGISGGSSEWTDGGGYLKPNTDGDSVRMYDSGGTDYVDISSDDDYGYVKFNAGYLYFQCERSLYDTTLYIDSQSGENASIILTSDNTINKSTYLGQVGTEFEFRPLVTTSRIKVNHLMLNSDFSIGSTNYEHCFMLDGSEDKAAFTNGTWVDGSCDGILNVIEAGNSENTYFSLANYNNTAHHPAIQFFNSRSNTMNGNGTTQDGDTIGEFYFYGNGSSAWRTAAKIEIVQNGSVSSYTPCDMNLYTSSNSAFNTGQLVLKTDGDISHSGDILPSASGTLDLGSPAVRYAEVHADDVYCDNCHVAETSLHIGQATIEASGSFLMSQSFVIENRDSDPASPAIGQMWFRTDV
jgi:hypothetical protein